MPKASKADQVAAIRAWQKAHADKVKQYNARYEAANHEERKRMKRAWWQAHRGTYGTRAQYLRVMKQTGGIGYSSSTGWQNRPKPGRPKKGQE
jgi:hypothetical protein